MTLDIDITDLNRNNIMNILQSYPRGHLEIKFERVFWCSETVEPQSTNSYPQQAPMNHGRPAGGQGGLAAGFERSLDVLGRMVC